MNRRSFIRSMGGCACATLLPSTLFLGVRNAAAAVAEKLDLSAKLHLADVALGTAKAMGASYADFRLCRYQSEYVEVREHRLEESSTGLSAGFGVRVLLDGTWGYASSSLATEDEVKAAVNRAVDVAKASQRLQARKFVLEDLPSYQDEWTMPMKTDPFLVHSDEKIDRMLAINEAALKAGADYATISFAFVREEKFLASSTGSRITQTRVRTMPDSEVTVIDKTTGKFASRDTLAAPRGSGYDYILDYDFIGEAAKAAEQAREKLKAKPVAPDDYDLVLDPTNLWLTIHESVGHPTELDRALGWEANFAGTTFCTPDKLGKLRYGSHLMNIVADRSQEGGLSTVGYDDDGIRSIGAEFPIIKDGVFVNYQMAIGQAQLIGQKCSNGCAFAESWSAFPIQRMPNVSLQPNPKPCSLEDLFSDVKRGIYIVGNGSWSIDQQRHNFQFGGQLFYEIRNGKLGGMLRDVAYQGSTVEFWNSMDGIGDKSTYFLGGAPNCGKGQPEQSAPVSHGAVPARFRQVTVLNTERKDIG
ncbi:MAG: TldD/PmbA family protein [Methylacidiphilales bacterium]|nr:TldD/PmbA family protein [Candidatus Methylacidiphilales bacterium]